MVSVSAGDEGADVRRAVFGVLTVALFVWMVLLFAGSPGTRDFEYDGDEPGTATVTCGPIAAVGWPFRTQPESARSEAGGPLSDDYVDGGVLPGDVTQQSILDQCQDLRATRLGFMTLLAVPTALCGVGALLPGRRSGQPAL